MTRPVRTQVTHTHTHTHVHVMYNNTNSQALRHYLLTSSCRSDTDDLSSITNLDLSAMPPSKDCLTEHIKRTNHQVTISRLAKIAISDIPKTWGVHGWTINGEPIWGSSDKIMPTSLVDILDTVTTSDSTRCHDGEW